MEHDNRPKEIYKPFLYPHQESLPNISIPVHRISDIIESEKIERYHFIKNPETGEMYPRRVYDHNAAHIMRGCLQIMTLDDLNFYEQEIMVDMFQLHDLPELGKQAVLGKRHDLTTIDKLKYPELAKEVESAESEWAEQNMTPSDLVLYREYEQAKPLLEGTEKYNSRNPIDPLALLTKIIDGTDGDSCFHYWMSKYVREHGFSTWDGSPPESNNNFLKRKVKYEMNLLQLPIADRYKKIGIDIFDNMIHFISDCWQDIDLTDAPSNLKKALSTINNE